ncbi:hypothetical protein [Marinobacter sp.]
MATQGDPMEVEAYQAGRMVEDLRAFIALRYPHARRMVMTGALGALAVEHGRGAGVEARDYIHQLLRTFAPLPEGWRKYIETGSWYRIAPPIPHRVALVKGKGKMIEASNGMVFPSGSAAAAWCRDNGHPKANSTMINRAMHSGAVAYGLTWARGGRHDA